MTAEVDLTAATRPSALPHRLSVHLMFWWLFILLHRPFYRRTKATNIDIDHIKVATFLAYPNSASSSNNIYYFSFVQPSCGKHDTALTYLAQQLQPPIRLHDARPIRLLRRYSLCPLCYSGHLRTASRASNPCHFALTNREMHRILVHHWRVLGDGCMRQRDLAQFL